MLSLSVYGFSQGSPNRFDEEVSPDIENRSNQNTEVYNEDPQPGPGNPGAIVPIDNYLPLLLTTALGIILYTTQKKKKLLS